MKIGFRFLASLSILMLMLLAGPAWGQRDTVTLQGQRYILAIESSPEDEFIQKQVHLLRLQGSQSKWLLRHTLQAESADCNSFAAEVGGYTVSDTSIVFYTIWMYTPGQMAGVCGVRKQAYIVDEKGRLAQGERICWAEFGPQHPCLDGLEAEQQDMLQLQPPKAVLADRRTFLACVEDELGAKVVLGAAKTALWEEAKQVLAEPLQKAAKHAAPDFIWRACD